MKPHHARLSAGPQTQAAGERPSSAPDRALLTRQQLLRRLARLDVVRCLGETEPATVRSVSGETVAVRAGWWSAAEIEVLLAELGLSASDFRDTR